MFQHCSTFKLEQHKAFGTDGGSVNAWLKTRKGGGMFIAFLVKEGQPGHNSLCVPSHNGVVIFWEVAAFAAAVHVCVAPVFGPDPQYLDL